MTNKNLDPYKTPPEWNAHVEGLNIYQRLHGVTADCRAVEKTRKQGIKFLFHGHADVTAMVKPLLEKWAVLQTVDVVELNHEPVTMYGDKQHFFVTAKVEVNYINIHKPEEMVTVHSYGHGVDNADKGSGKAITYAVKYAEIKAFHISDGEERDVEEFTYKPAPSEVDAEFRAACEQAGLDTRAEAKALQEKHKAKSWASVLDVQKRQRIQEIEAAGHVEFPTDGEGEAA